MTGTSPRPRREFTARNFVGTPGRTARKPEFYFAWCWVRQHPPRGILGLAHVSPAKIWIVDKTTEPPKKDDNTYVSDEQSASGEGDRFPTAGSHRRVGRSGSDAKELKGGTESWLVIGRPHAMRHSWCTKQPNGPCSAGRTGGGLLAGAYEGWMMTTWASLGPSHAQYGLPQSTGVKATCWSTAGYRLCCAVLPYPSVCGDCLFDNLDWQAHLCCMHRVSVHMQVQQRVWMCVTTGTVGIVYT